MYCTVHTIVDYCTYVCTYIDVSSLSSSSLPIKVRTLKSRVQFSALQSNKRGEHQSSVAEIKMLSTYFWEDMMMAVTLNCRMVFFFALLGLADIGSSVTQVQSQPLCNDTIQDICRVSFNLSKEDFSAIALGY